MGLLVKEAPQSSMPSCYGRCSRGRAVRKRGRLSPDPHLLAPALGFPASTAASECSLFTRPPRVMCGYSSPNRLIRLTLTNHPQARATTAASTGLLSGHFTPMTHRTWP